MITYTFSGNGETTNLIQTLSVDFALENFKVITLLTWH